MKVWRCNSYDADLGTLVSWWPNRKKALAKYLSFKEERGIEAAGPEDIELVEIPTTKKKLIDWLNANLETDNG